MREERIGDLIECPYCGFVDGDSWEVGPNETEFCTTTNCASCGEEMNVAKSISVTYKTWKRGAE